MIGLEGITAGMAHVLTGPDHLVGVAPLAVERPGRVPGWRIGLAWGVGHGIGVAILGVLAHTLLSIADVEFASGWAERLVGVLLIVLGLVAIRRSRGLTVHAHAHEHGEDGEHVHLHVHGADGTHGHPKREDGHGHDHAALGVGTLHGLAGGGHFWAMLPSLAMSRSDAAVYIGGYIAASVVIMALFGGLMERIAGTFGVAWLPRFVAGVGTMTVGVGIWWLAAAW